MSEFLQACALLVAFGASLLGCLALWRALQVRGWHSALAFATSTLGLSRVPGVRGRRLAGAVGRVGPATLALEAEPRGSHDPAVTQCRVVADVPMDVVLTTATLRFEETPGPVSAIELDADYEAHGVRAAVEQAITQALFDPALRARLQAAARWRFQVAFGVVALSRGGLVDDAAELVAMARLALDVATALDRIDLAGRLAHTALTDADPDRALAACFARLGRPDRDDFLLRASREAATGGVRLVAARRLGAEGVRAARALALDAGQPMALRASALALLFEHRHASAVSAAHGLLAAPSDDRWTPGVLHHLLRADALPDRATLAALIEPAGPATRRALATCFAALGAEEPLLTLLADADDGVAAEAARGLGQHGTAAAVPALQARARRGRVAAVCLAAVDEIQKQIKGVRGSLSVAGAAGGGALSAVEGEGG